MNKRVKKLWIKALRSGKFKQAKRKLRTEQRFCCLGVLCQLHATETNHRWHRGKRFTYFKVSDVLPVEVSKWAGLKDDSNPSVNGELLAVLNDSGETFEDIADRIDKYL